MQLIMPLFAAAIVIFGLIKRVAVFDVFLEGAKEGISTVYKIAPVIVGLIFAVSLLRNSGAMELIQRAVSPAAGLLGFPPEVVPMALLRPVSGGGSTALLLSVFDACGPDSFAGRVASVLAGSSETTFYAAATYFGSVGVTKTRHTLIAAVAADLTAMIMSVICVRFFFGG